MGPTNRRNFLKLSALAVAAPLVARFVIPTARAADLPMLPLDNPQAKALAYVEDAKDTTHAAFKPGSNCLNCQFFIAANGACTLIPGFAVTAEGWCAVWAKKA